MTLEIIPTNTCPPDWAELTRRSEAFSAYADEIHLDLSDGRFSPVTSWPYAAGQWVELTALGAHSRLPFADRARYEVHLMVEDPLEIGSTLAAGGARRIIGHVEAFANAAAGQAVARAWRAAGASEVGMALLFNTPLESLEPYANTCDSVLLMTIATIGRQGIPFDPRGIERVREARRRFPNLTIAVDGGVSLENAPLLIAAGATRLSIGSAIVKTEDPVAAYTAFAALG